jgi:proton-dependent oligopeptide transporter, POT family
LGNLISIVLAVRYWPVLKDRATPLVQAAAAEFRKRFAIGVAILVGLVPVVWGLLQHPDSTTTLVEIIAALVYSSLVWVTMNHPLRSERRNMWAYLVLAVGSLVFWSLYQMSSSGLTLFFDRNVDPMVLGLKIQPQWVQNINTFVIFAGGPALALLFSHLRGRGWRIDVPKQFATALVLMGVGFLVLPLGIALGDPATGRSAFIWIFLSYVLQSIGELLISPVGYAMIGKLAPHKYQGVMMGAWMLLTGLASIFAGQLSKSIPSAQDAAPQVTNQYYAQLFSWLGWGTVAVGVVLALLIPFLRRLISDQDTPEVDELAPAVVPH